ncbi:hypothetical protein ACFQGX_15885 [Nonomuraea dietziae]|uniref:hypothetical protein n=1 Tax=Nonomuraea dietziae TaxID=65515 RepID=UPI00360D9E2B
MARHDREESLEEQLAWLDAIKETDEEPVKVSAKTGAVATDETIVSPYPKDPWLSVPTEQDTPTPPLFRAAVDSVYGQAAAEELPAEEVEAAEWFESSVEAERPPTFGRDDDDAFLAPLKPLPRPDDTDSYRMGAFDPQAEERPEPQSSMFDPLPPEERTDPSWPRPPWPQPAAESFEGIADVETVQGELVPDDDTPEPGLPRHEEPEPRFDAFRFDDPLPREPRVRRSRAGRSPGTGRSRPRSSGRASPSRRRWRWPCRKSRSPYAAARSRRFPPSPCRPVPPPATGPPPRASTPTHCCAVAATPPPRAGAG